MFEPLGKWDDCLTPLSAKGVLTETSSQAGKESWSREQRLSPAESYFSGCTDGEDLDVEQDLQPGDEHSPAARQVWLSAGHHHFGCFDGIDVDVGGDGDGEGDACEDGSVNNSDVEVPGAPERTGERNIFFSSVNSFVNNALGVSEKEGVSAPATAPVGIGEAAMDKVAATEVKPGKMALREQMSAAAADHTDHTVLRARPMSFDEEFLQRQRFKIQSLQAEVNQMRQMLASALQQRDDTYLHASHGGGFAAACV